MTYPKFLHINIVIFSYITYPTSFELYCFPLNKSANQMALNFSTEQFAW